MPVEGRYPLFGTLEGERAETAFVRLNPFGRRVCQMLSGLAQFYKEKGYALKVLAQMVMPDHVHLVIQVLEPLPRSIGAVVRGFKSGCTKVYKDEYYYSGEDAAGVHGEALVHFARIFAGRGSIWQQDKAYYHERILHAPGQLRMMIDYVKDNPRRLWLKSRNPDLFRMHRETMLCGMPFTSMGNHFLLQWPDRQLVEMSRSAAISDGERLIAKTVREQDCWNPRNVHTISPLLSAPQRMPYARRLKPDTTHILRFHMTRSVTVS